VAALRDHGLEHRDTIKVGRTHGVHAEPDVWGHRVADLAFAMARSRDRLREARARVDVVAISGAVGTYSLIDPSVEGHVAEALGLRAADASTQVVLRDSISEWVSALAIIATVCEAIALEVRHGQRTEVRELSEAFGSGQKGSSAMPHKKNPILSENLTGLARLLRGYAGAALEDVALWHERDISHSSVERVSFPDATILADFMLARTTGLVSGLVIHAERMRANLEASGGLCFSEAVLLALVGKGLARQEAYVFVQRCAHAALRAGAPADFRRLLGEDPDVSARLSAGELDACFDLEHHLRHVPAIMARALGDPPP
jgi:adenylosuccinate lyase